MLEREKPKGVAGQLDSINNTRRIITTLTKHTSFSGTDAAELLVGLDRLEAGIVLEAPQVQDAREVVSSMLVKGLVPKESADSFFALFNDPETADLLRKDVLPVPNPAVINQKPQATKREALPVVSQDTQVTKIGRRKFLVGGAGAAILGVGSFFAIEEANRQETARQAEVARAAAQRRVARAEAVRQEATRSAEAARKAGIERAAILFGEDFLGEQAIHKLESKFRAVGIYVEFEIPIIPFHLNQAQLEAAKKDEKRGKARMVVLRPEFMTARGQRQRITFLSLYSIYGVNTIYNPFAADPWFYSEPFVKEGLKAKFALPTKEVVPGSLDKNWDDQEKLIESGESRREVVEVLWDILLYNGATGIKLLGSHLDWTKTYTGNGCFGCLGSYSLRGYDVKSRKISDNDRNIGVCTTL